LLWCYYSFSDPISTDFLPFAIYQLPVLSIFYPSFDRLLLTVPLFRNAPALVPLLFFAIAVCLFYPLFISTLFLLTVL
jgi:hypothetical protein